MSDEEKKEKIKAYQKQYKQDHKEQHRKYMNDYVAKAPAILCACGGRFKQYSGYKHNQTKKHVRFLCEVLENNKPEVNEDIKSIEIVDLDELEMKTLEDLENPKLKINKSDLFVVITGEPEPEDKPVKTKRKKPSKSAPLPKTEIHNIVA
jgi:hypothetical protein